MLFDRNPIHWYPVRTVLKCILIIVVEASV